MDIASVYLNLASLLGTEIEVEGYYAVAHWPSRVFLYSTEHETDSTSIFLSTFVRYNNLVNTFSAPMKAKVFVKGTLTQNAHGDPMMRGITSISYQTNDVIFNVTCTYEGNQIICHQRTDLVFNWMAYLQGQHRPIRDYTLAALILSKPVLLEGYLIPCVVNSDGSEQDMRLVLVVEDIAYSLADLQQNDPPPSESDMFQLLIGIRPPGDKTRAEQSDSEYVDARWHNQIWIPSDSQSYEYLDQYFGACRRVEGTYRTTKKHLKYTFAGIIDSIDETERKENLLMPRARLKFTTIDYIVARRTVTYALSLDI